MRELLEHRDIIHDPKGATVRRGYELIFARIDREVSNLNSWQIERERLPLRAAVEADVRGAPRPGKEQARFARILPYDEDVLIGRKAVRQRGPMRAVVGRFVDVRMKVVPHVARCGEIGRTLLGMRRLDRTDLRPLRQLRRR